MAAGSAHILFRLVQTDPPTIRDFLSHEALGLAPTRPLTVRQQDQWRSVSHYATVEAARLRARLSTHLGTYVARIHVPGGVSVRVEQSGRDPLHFSVWAEPADLLGWVVSVEPVEPVH